MNDKQYNALMKISTMLNDNGINWGLGGSAMLYLRGIQTSIADLDIIVDLSSFHMLKRMLRRIDYKLSSYDEASDSNYTSKHFIQLNLDGVDIDIIVGFEIKTDNTHFIYPKGDDLSKESLYLDNAEVRLCDLQDWIEAYTVMGRTEKLKLIKNSNK